MKRRKNEDGRRHVRSQEAGRRKVEAGNWKLTALFLAGVFLVKLVVMLQLKDHPLLQPEGGLDSVTFMHLAERLRGGDVALGPGLYFVSPLYIYFLAAMIGIGGSFTFVRLVQIALGTAAVWCVLLTARAWFGARAGWIAAALAALTGVFTFYEIVILQSALDTFLTAAALYALTRAVVPPNAAQVFGPPLVAGAIFGLQVLNRPNVAIAGAGIVVVLIVVRRTRVGFLLAAGMAIALAPVVVRNAVVAHEFALVSSQGGLNFYTGNNPSATGQYNAVPGVRANIEGQSDDTRAVAEKAVGHALTDREVSSYFTLRAMAWMHDHPGSAAKLFVKKLALVFNYRHQWLDFSYPYYAHDTGSILAFLIVGPWVLVPLGFLGAGLLLSGVSSTGPSGSTGSWFVWWSFVPLYALSVALFFVAERYRLPLFVPLCVTAGAAIDWLLCALRHVAARDLGPPISVSRSPIPGPRVLIPGQRSLAIVALFVAAAIVAFWPFHLNDGRYDERLRLAKALMNARDFGRAAAELDEAHRLDPSDTVAEFNLGMALIDDGRAAEGIPHVRHALDAGVPIEGARYALAAALMAVDRDEAARLLRTFSPAPGDSADSCYRVALLALNAGVPDVAARYLRRAAALQPGRPDVEQLLQRIGR